MSEPILASRVPFAVDVQEGTTYWWCACGRSKRQPFCDGSHKTTEFTPVEFVARRTERVWFCGCKRSAGRPLCDGTHKTIAGASQERRRSDGSRDRKTARSKDAT